MRNRTEAAPVSLSRRRAALLHIGSRLSLDLMQLTEAVTAPGFVEQPTYGRLAEPVQQRVPTPL